MIKQKECMIICMRIIRTFMMKMKSYTQLKKHKKRKHDNVQENSNSNLKMCKKWTILPQIKKKKRKTRYLRPIKSNKDLMVSMLSGAKDGIQMKSEKSAWTATNRFCRGQNILFLLVPIIYIRRVWEIPYIKENLNVLHAWKDS